MPFCLQTTVGNKSHRNQPEPLPVWLNFLVFLLKFDTPGQLSGLVAHAAGHTEAVMSESRELLRRWGGTRRRDVAGGGAAGTTYLLAPGWHGRQDVAVSNRSTTRPLSVGLTGPDYVKSENESRDQPVTAPVVLVGVSSQ